MNIEALFSEKFQYQYAVLFIVKLFDALWTQFLINEKVEDQNCGGQSEDAVE